MRGFLDGDGSITKGKNSFSINYTIKNPALVDFIIDCSKPYYQFNKHYDSRSNCYKIEIQSISEAQKFKHFVYHTNFSFCLKRKLKVLNEILGN